jgi:uncharacterized membrane protein YcaP (DUF421 family)
MPHTFSFGDALEIILRSGVVYIVLIIIFRLAGKHSVSQLSIIDFILILLVSNAVQNAMVGEDSSLHGGLIAALTLVGLNVILTKLSLRSSRFSKIVEGEPLLLIHDGKLLKKRLRAEGLREEEIYEAIRKAGYSRPDEVGMAILETDGTISVIGKENIEKK